MNDIDNEADTDGSAYVWIDGSASTYRNFGTLDDDFPRGFYIDHDCVRLRYRVSNVLSQGWLNAPCDETRNCYFCSKQGITLFSVMIILDYILIRLVEVRFNLSG